MGRHRAHAVTTVAMILAWPAVLFAQQSWKIEQSGKVTYVAARTGANTTHELDLSTLTIVATVDASGVIQSLSKGNDTVSCTGDDARVGQACQSLQSLVALLPLLDAAKTAETIPPQTLSTLQASCFPVAVLTCNGNTCTANAANGTIVARRSTSPRQLSVEVTCATTGGPDAAGVRTTATTVNTTVLTVQP